MTPKQLTTAIGQLEKLQQQLSSAEGQYLNQAYFAVSNALDSLKAEQQQARGVVFHGNVHKANS